MFAWTINSKKLLADNKNIEKYLSGNSNGEEFNKDIILK